MVFDILKSNLQFHLLHTIFIMFGGYTVTLTARILAYCIVFYYWVVFVICIAPYIIIMCLIAYGIMLYHVLYSLNVLHYRCIMYYV